ncbi:hypothetical protein BIV60_11385 [Bacillus sp. MUM 116]|uniref:hypothetical protein n=1 Tax=Bacillus sp. MUM 116 TaxID=1678002 RepID=UPI0008F5883D|nr:hypothetical protein [Bacillus sp. MUM 116]OIK14562.1 hypothetical protein BIV60_11385 [Bacillus sp. MUM 116]
MFGVVKLNQKEFLVDFSEHAMLRTEQRLEETDVQDFVNTLHKLAEEDFAFGMYGEMLVVRDFYKNKALVYVLDRTDKNDFDICDEAIDFKSKITIVTLFHDAKAFKQSPTQRVVVIDGENQFIDDETAISYSEYLEWVKEK